MGSCGEHYCGQHTGPQQPSGSHNLPEGMPGHMDLFLRVGGGADSPFDMVPGDDGGGDYEDSDRDGGWWWQW